jgi:polysaccharide biosynthesis transport protein
VDGEILEPAEYLVKRPLSQYSESIRALRVSLQMADVDNPPKVVLITSSTPAEGKSTLAVSLAFSAAAAGQRVLLIDCDLRRPQLSRLFGLETKPGLVDVLTGNAEVEDVLADRAGLTMLPAGSKTPNPPDLLGSAKMQSLLTAARATYDYVVLDSAPVGPVVDSRVLSHVADKTIYVVRWRATPREIALQNLDLVRMDRKVAGIALNLVDETKTSRYGANAYYSGRYQNRYYEG